MSKKKIVILSLFITLIVLIVGFSFLNKNINFKRCFVKFFELGDIDYEFPSPSKYTYNINGFDEIISFTTNREYFLNEFGETIIYKDFDDKSEITVLIINKDALMFYNSINSDGELVKKDLENGMKYIETTNEGKFHIYVLYESEEYAYVISFSCEDSYKESFLNDFRELLVA